MGVGKVYYSTPLLLYLYSCHWLNYCFLGYKTWLNESATEKDCSSYTVAIANNTATTQSACCSIPMSFQLIYFYPGGCFAFSHHGSFRINPKPVNTTHFDAGTPSKPYCSVSALEAYIIATLTVQQSNCWSTEKLWHLKTTSGPLDHW